MIPIVFQCFRLILECSLIYNLFSLILLILRGQGRGLGWSGVVHMHIFSRNNQKSGKAREVNM